MLLLYMLLAADFELTRMPSREACQRRMDWLEKAADRCATEANWHALPSNRRNLLRVGHILYAQRKAWSALEDAQFLRRAYLERRLSEDGCIKMVRLALELVLNHPWLREEVEHVTLESRKGGDPRLPATGLL